MNAFQNVYEGTVDSGELNWQVTVNGKALPQRQDLRNHSPCGFAWGYGGSGPAQLALAILCYELGDEKGEQLYQGFKWDIISRLEQDKPFRLTSQDIHRWAKRAEESRSQL